ncbi:MAG: PKD domain-containing protein [Chloroflexi bacterium]|nr:PKD domain-containing protein [Chloroflexota bacterium]
MKRLFSLIISLIFIFALVFVFTIKPAPAAQSPILDHEFVVVRAYFDDPAMVASVAQWREPWEVDYNKNFLVIEVNADEYLQLEKEGFRLEIEPDLTAQYNTLNTRLPGQISGIPGYECYRTVEETFTSAQDIATQYPQLATWIDAGDSWEKVNLGGLPGYDMMVLKLTNSAISGPKPKLFATSAIHAREYTTAELSTRFAEYLVQNYGVDADVTWLLDYHEIHLMLHTNPDGRKRAETGLLWRKNTNNNYCANSNSRGADLNRNFSFEWGNWGGSSGIPCDDTYRGPSAASEPETQAVQNYIQAEYPDLRPHNFTVPAPITTTGIYIDIHSYSELVLWAWGFTYNVPPNGIQMQTLGRKFAYFNNYNPMQSRYIYSLPTDGTTDDFAYGEMGLPAYTFELGTNFFQACGTFENTILPDNLPALIYAAKAVRQPYIAPAGPDALNVSLSSVAVAAGDIVTLTATLNDTRYNNQNGAEPNQNIAAAAYYIDTPPWITTTTPISMPMTAVDGNFNSNVEDVYAAIDTTGLSDGRHTIFVHGQDANGIWGVFSARFLYIIDPAVAPILGGTVTAADTGLPLTATISANNIFQTTSDPATGQYQMQVISDTYMITVASSNPNYASQTITDVVAHNGQTINQDFALYPYCDIFFDDVESGNVGWTAQLPWAITTENANSPTHSWTDSPGGNYGNNRNVSLTSPVFDLTSYSNITLNYSQICDTEAGWDYCHVEVATDGGTIWNEVAAYDGSHSQWENIDLPLPALDNQANARLRFRFTSDVSVIDDGWHLDDVRLRGAGTACIVDMLPQAGFTSTTPDALGEATTFGNNSSGDALNFTWDFGDGITSTAVSPTHTYAITGSFMVTLTAANAIGSDNYTDTVEILVEPQAAFTTSSPTTIGSATVFTNSSSGDNLTYLWAFGDGITSTAVSPTHTYAITGTFTVTLTASNNVGSDSATTAVQVIDGAIPPTMYKLFLPVIVSNNTTAVGAAKP